MKAIYKNIALAALAFSAVACTQEEDFAPSSLNDPDAVRITAQVASGNVTGGFTRSNPLGTTEEQAKFNDGDQIAVTAGNQTAVTYTFNGTDTWTPEEGKYLKWEADEMNFTAWYPVGEGTDANTFNVPTEYTEESPIAYADYMVYTGTQNKTDDNGVTLPMERKMARIVITPEMNDEFAEGYSITGIKVHANTSGYANGEPQTGNIQVSALKQGNAYYALLAPTTADANATFLTVTVTDGTNSQNLTVKDIPATAAGQSYEYALTVGKDKATIGNVKVNPWTDGTAIPGGEAVEIPYLTFTVRGEQSLVLNVMGELDSSIQYSADGGAWTNFETSGVVDEYGMSTTTPVPFTNNLRMRGKSESGTMDFTTPTGFMISFTEDTPVTCSGDIRTLVDYTSYETTSTANACFFGLFMNCSALADASGLKLISNNNEMAESCYESMFAGCEKLTSAPGLPATTLASYCYKGMFMGCTSLKSAPELPAEELAVFCYVDMFNSCTSLESAPALPATTLAQSCYVEMFAGCSNLTTAPAKLPAPTLADNCYSNMFANCSNLVSAPVLPAEALVTGCYWQMFKGCTNLNSVTMLATNISATNCLTGWMSGVPAGGTFTKAASLVQGTGYGEIPEGANGIPSGWTVQDYEAPGEGN